MDASRRGQGDLGKSVADRIRVGSIAIAAYDYLLTLPAEWRFWESQRQRNQISIDFCLFILLRYTSIATIIINGYTYFDGGFSPTECEKWYFSSPAMKALQLLVSQAIMAWRVSQYFSPRPRSQLVPRGVFWDDQDQLRGNGSPISMVAFPPRPTCRAVDENQVAWIYYIFAVAFDITTTGIAMLYMIQFDASTNLMFQLKRLLIAHGLAYFICLTAVNALNLALYVCYDGFAQSAAVPLTHAPVWILSQRILIDLHELSSKRSPFEGSEESESVVIYITGSTTDDQYRNDRASERE